MAWPNDSASVTGRRRPWREKQLGALKHSGAEELRVTVSWQQRGDPAILEARQWDLRHGPDGVPSRHGIRLPASHVPWLIDKLTEAAVLEAGIGEDFIKEN